VKYRVNLYREREEKALRFRKGLVRGAVLVGVVAAEAVLLGLLLASGLEMETKAREMRRQVSGLEARVKSEPGKAGLQEMRTLLRARLARVDWATTLSAVAEAVPAEIVLTEVRGGIGGEHGRVEGIEIEGRLAPGVADLAPVFAFMEALKADPVVSQNFPRVDLGTAKDRGNTFQIICRRGEPGHGAPGSERSS
jgi:Tfp pilus assembly protein PilN